MQREKVWGVPRAQLPPLPERGFFPDEEELVLGQIQAAGMFRDRETSESDESFKQIIPQIIVLHENRIFVMERLKGSAEDRLHHLQLIAVGGHVNPTDGEATDPETLWRGAIRELQEEIVFPVISQDGALSFLGWLNDDTNEVGRVHLGAVFLMQFSHASLQVQDVAVRETHKLRGQWEDAEETWRRYREAPERFESWSGIMLEALSQYLGW